MLLINELLINLQFPKNVFFLFYSNELLFFSFDVTEDNSVSFRLDYEKPYHSTWNLN
jgi:hypothetical protein